jgi:hypothetical protein
MGNENKVSVAAGCTQTLLAPWKAGTQIWTRVTVTCPTIAKQIIPGAGLSPDGLNWDWYWAQNICNNAKSCTVTLSIKCKTGYWYSLAQSIMSISPAPRDIVSGRTYIKCWSDILDSRISAAKLNLLYGIQVTHKFGCRIK